ncbi:MAG: hypothetical protein ACU0CJ_01290, partial [Sulfitobacter sp.]
VITKVFPSSLPIRSGVQPCAPKVLSAMVLLLTVKEASRPVDLADNSHHPMETGQIVAITCLILSLLLL